MAADEFDRRARLVYTQVRDGTVSPEAAFDLACVVLEWFPTDELAAELAEVAAAATDQRKLAELSRRLLDERFEPDFEAEPALFAALQAALGTVLADVAATKLPGQPELIVPGWSDPPRAYARYGGYTSNSGGIAPSAGRDQLSALVAVADDLQEAVMECRFEVWPVCPSHQLGPHAQLHGGQAVWWCNGDGGHAAAPIGSWGA